MFRAISNGSLYREVVSEVDLPEVYLNVTRNYGKLIDTVDCSI